MVVFKYFIRYVIHLLKSLFSYLQKTRRTNISTLYLWVGADENICRLCPWEGQCSEFERFGRHSSLTRLNRFIREILSQFSSNITTCNVILGGYWGLVLTKILSVQQTVLSTIKYIHEASIRLSFTQFLQWTNCNLYG